MGFQIKNNFIYISMQKLEYLGINLTEYVKDLNKEIYKTLRDKIKE